MDYFEYRDAIFSSNLTTTQKIVAFAISYHYNWKEGTPAFPSNATLSRETSLSISAIVKAKKVLSDNGWVLIKRRLDDTSEYTPSIGEQLVCSQSSTNNEVNNEHNNEVNNELKDNKSSNEDLYLNQKEDKKPEGIITLDINEIIVPTPLADKGTAGSAARSKEHARLLELADELWS